MKMKLMSISRFFNWFRIGSSLGENKTEWSSQHPVRRGRQSEDDPIKKKFSRGITLFFKCSSSSWTKPRKSEKKSHNVKPKPLKKVAEKSPAPPEDVFPPPPPPPPPKAPPPEDFQNCYWDIKDADQWGTRGMFIPNYPVIFLDSSHTSSPQYYFDAVSQDHNPAFDKQSNLYGITVEPSSIPSPRPPTPSDRQNEINTWIESYNYDYTGIPNPPALQYSQNQSINALEVESNMDYAGGGENNIMINQHVAQKDLDVANKDSDTNYEETDNTTCSTTPARKNNRRTKKISINREDLERHFTMNMDAAARNLDVGRSTLKRICRKNGIERLPACSLKGKKINDEQSPNPKNENLNDNDQTNYESTRSSALIVNRPLREACSSSSNNVRIKATYGDDIAKFPFSVSSGLNDSKEKVCQRLEINIPIKLKCIDDDGDLIVISCDDALHELIGKRLLRSGDNSNTTFDFKVFQITN